MCATRHVRAKLNTRFDLDKNVPKIRNVPHSHPAAPYAKPAAAPAAPASDASVDVHAPLTEAQAHARQAVARMQAPGLKAAQAMLAGEQEGHGIMRYITPANNGGSAVAPSLGEAHGGHASLDPGHWSAGFGSDLTASGNRGGASLGTTQQVDGAPLTLGAFQDITAVGGAVGGRLWGDGQGDALNVQALGLSNLQVHGVGTSLGWVGAAGERVGATAVALVSAGTELKSLHTYAGTNPQLQGKRLVEWEEFAAPGLHLNVSGGAHTFGVGGMLEMARNRTTLYRKWVDPAALQGMQERRDSKLQPVRSLLQGLGLARKEVNVPALKHLASGKAPVALEEGEQITLRVAHSGKLGVSGGMYGVRAGVFFSQTNESEMTVRRLNESEVEAAFIPKKARTLSANVDVAVGAEAYASASNAEATTQSFAFNVDLPSGREGLDKMLKGELPSPAAPVHRTGINEQGAVILAGKVRGDVLAPGVRRTFIEKSRRLEARQGAGMLRPFVSKTVAGLSRHGSSFEEEQLVTPGDAARLTKTYGHENETQRFTLGTVKKNTQGSVRTTALFDENTQPLVRTDGVVAQSEFVHERVRGDARSRAAKELGAAFGKEVQPFKERADFNNLTIASKVVLTNGHVTEMQRKSSAEIGAAAVDAGSTAAKLERALSLGHHGIAKYLGEEGIRGQGAVTRLLGQEKMQTFVKVTTQSSAYDEPMNKWDNFPRAKLEDATPGSRKHRKVLEKLARLNKRMGSGVRHTNDDGIIRAFDQPEFIKRLSTISSAYQETGALLRTQQQRLELARNAGSKR